MSILLIIRLKKIFQNNMGLTRNYIFTKFPWIRDLESLIMRYTQNRIQSHHNLIKSLGVNYISQFRQTCIFSNTMLQKSLSYTN